MTDNDIDLKEIKTDRLNTPSDLRINMNDLKRPSIGRNIKNEIIHHKMELEEKALDNEFKSCCGLSIDRRVVGLLNKTLIIFIVLIFSLLQLFIIDESTEKSLYFNLVVLILGTAISPNKNDKKSNDK